MRTRNSHLIIILALTMFLVGCISPGGDPVVSPPPDNNPENPAQGNEPPDTPPEGVPADADAEVPSGGEVPEPGDIEGLIAFYSFLSYPIKGGKVSSVNGQLPNAPRSYRNGVHEGLDFYSVSRGTPVLAAAAGVVIRADHGYEEMTMEKYNEIIRISKEEAITPPEILDMLRGRQVWIEHQNGIITRYAHLDSVAAEVVVGDEVEKGQEIGTVGDSGSKSGVAGRTLSASGAPHLHFEIWQGSSFLGQGLTPDQVRHIYREVLKD
jgi:murein DD-endopeptidase MepM/ murein hydrolase activator NlpD